MTEKAEETSGLLKRGTLDRRATNCWRQGVINLSNACVLKFANLGHLSQNASYFKRKRLHQRVKQGNQAELPQCYLN